MADEIRLMREAIDELRGRQSAHDDQLHALAADVGSMRRFRDWSEAELSRLRVDFSALASVLDELMGLPEEVRGQFQLELAGVQEELRRQISLFAGDSAALAICEVSGAASESHAIEDGSVETPEDGQVETPEDGQVEAQVDGPVEAQVDEPAEAQVDEPAEAPDEAPVETQLDGGHATAVEDPPPDQREPPLTEFSPPRFTLPAQRSDWLAKAIRAVAQHRSPTLAGELVLELVQLHARLCESPLTYELQIEELGRHVVHIADGHATLAPHDDASEAKPRFTLSGSAPAFAELAGGGTSPRRAGLSVKGSRRDARRLRRACSDPVALADLADARIAVWPGLLLAALAEATDPSWTRGSEFAVAFVISGDTSASFHVEAQDGAPLVVVPAGGETGRASGLQPVARIHAGEHALLAMLAGVEPRRDERVMISGEQEPVQTLLGWFAQAQGLAARAD